jgi:hypothetical protein
LVAGGAQDAQSSAAIAPPAKWEIWRFTLS